MSKAGGGAGSAPGPTAAAAAQKQKSLLQKADADVTTLVDNFSSLINIARVRPRPTLPQIRHPGTLLITLARDFITR
jgi:mediator of RNA polymerase II transcription subunit 22